MENFKRDLLQDRYACFDKYRDRSPFFAPELNAHVFLKYADIITCLKNPLASSNRKQKQFEEVRHCPFSKNLAGFYENWLMYMDGDRHTETRKNLNQSLSQAAKRILPLIEGYFDNLVRTGLFRPGEQIDIVAAVSKPFVTHILSRLFGLKFETYIEIIKVSKPIVMFLGNGDVKDDNARREVAASLSKTYQIMSDAIAACEDEESLIGEMIKNGNSSEIITPILINVIIDGFDPLLSVLTNYFYFRSRHEKNPLFHQPVMIFDELLRLEPPFQYCARLASGDMDINGYQIEAGERMMSFIGAGNRDPQVFSNAAEIEERPKIPTHLSFGMGAHFCSGATLSRKVSISFFENINSVLKDKFYEIVDYEWIDSLGYRMLAKLQVKIF